MDPLNINIFYNMTLIKEFIKLSFTLKTKIVLKSECQICLTNAVTNCICYHVKFVCFNHFFF